MSTPTTIASKLEAVTNNETKLLAAIQANRSQAAALETQYKQMEEQRNVFAGAKLILNELVKESNAADTEKATDANVELLPPQS